MKTSSKHKNVSSYLLGRKDIIVCNKIHINSKTVHELQQRIIKEDGWWECRRDENFSQALSYQSMSQVFIFRWHEFLSTLFEFLSTLFIPSVLCYFASFPSKRAFSSHRAHRSEEGDSFQDLSLLFFKKIIHFMWGHPRANMKTRRKNHAPADKPTVFCNHISNSEKKERCIMMGFQQLSSTASASQCATHLNKGKKKLQIRHVHHTNMRLADRQGACHLRTDGDCCPLVSFITSYLSILIEIKVQMT